MRLDIALPNEFKNRNEVLQNDLIKALLSRTPNDAATWATEEITKPVEKDALLKALTKAVVFLLNEKK